MFKEFLYPENTDKELSVQYFSPDHPKNNDRTDGRFVMKNSNI